MSAPRVWWDRLAPLMSRPSRWELITTVHPSTIGQLRSRALVYPEGEFEFTAEPCDGGKVRLFARYMGPVA